MTPERYAGLRGSLGDHRRAARILECSPTTLQARERGRYRITEEAAARLVEAVHAAALAENERRERRRERRLRPWREVVITPAQFRTAMRLLGWRYRTQAAEALLGDERDVGPITKWLNGRRRIPWWVARDLRAALNLGPEDPWPSGMTCHELVLPEL